MTCLLAVLYNDLFACSAFIMACLLAVAAGVHLVVGVMHRLKAL